MAKKQMKKVVKTDAKVEKAAAPAATAAAPAASAQPEFTVDSDVRSKVKEATAALKLYLEKKAEASGESALFGDESTAVVQFSLLKIPARETQRPVQIELPHPLFDPEQSSVCVFVKDDMTDKTKKSHEVKRKLWKNLVLDGAKKEGLTHVKKVISLEKLKKEFKQYEDKRQLAEAHDLFLCDKAIIETMPACLGKVFMKQYKSKFPSPVKIGKEDAISDIKRALHSTPLRIPSGPCVGVRLGQVSKFSEEQLAENVLAVLSEAAHHLGATCGVKSVHLTATNSGLALPVFERASANREVRKTLKGETWKERNPEKDATSAEEEEKSEASEEKVAVVEKKKATLPLLKKKKKKVTAVKK